MPKFTINPSFGKFDLSNNLSFSLSDIENINGLRISFENATHNSVVKVDGQDFINVEPNVNEISGNLDLNIPEYSSQTIISIYATVESRNEEGYKIEGIYSCFYTLKEEAEASDFELKAAPAFVGPADKSQIQVKGAADESYIVSINDKRFKIKTDSSGIGSFSFDSHSILEDSDLPVMQRFAIYGYSSQDNYVNKKFSGSYIHVLPKKIATLATCSGSDQNEECFEIDEFFTQKENLVDEPPRPQFSVKDIAERTSCSNINLSASNVCRVDDYSMCKLPNGSFLYSYVGHDDSNSDNTLNQVFVNYTNGSNSKRTLPRRAGIIPPDEDNNFYIFVEEGIYQQVTTSWSIRIYSEDFDNQAFSILEKIEPDENSPFYRLRLDASEFEFEFNSYYLCIPYVAESSTAPFVRPPAGSSFPLELPVIEQVLGQNTNQYTILKASVAVNNEFAPVDQLVPAYVVAEARVGKESQLFYYAFWLGVTQSGQSLSVPVDNSGWVQLTYEGENRNPVVRCDKAGTLHVFWEGDRKGLTQIYYGCLGAGARSAFNAALVGALDREAESIISDNDYWEKSSSILSDVTSPSSLNIVKKCEELGTPYLPNNMWLPYETGSGIAMPYDDSLLSVSGNTSSDQAIIFTTVDQDENGNKFDGTSDQMSFAIDFDLSDMTPNEVLNDKQIEDLYKDWRSKFIEDRVDELNNQVYYKYKGNKFRISRWQREVDRFFPIIGSYKNEGLAAKFENCEEFSEDDFIAHVSGDSKNVNHFMIGLMPEKVRFKADNIQSFQEFCSEHNLSVEDCFDQYVLEEETIISTGRYQLLVIMAGDNRYYGSPRKAGYNIVKKIGEPFGLDTAKNIHISPHYIKLFEEDVNLWYENIGGIEEHGGRYLMSLAVFIDKKPVFGDSILVNLEDGYRAFDIGVGFPGGSQWYSSERRLGENSTYASEDVELLFENFVIGSPSMDFNVSIANFPEFYRSRIVNVAGNTVETESENYTDKYDLINLGLDQQPIIPQVPITGEGHNKAPSISQGGFGSAFGLVWQTNKDRYWNVAYADNLERTLPFRRQVDITKSKSNSLMPSVAISPDGDRMVVWHDNVSGKYQIYAARSNSAANGISVIETLNCESIAANVVLQGKRQEDDGPVFVPCSVGWQLCVQPCGIPEGYIAAYPCVECDPGDALAIFLPTTLFVNDVS